MSTAALEFAGPFLHRVEFHHDRRKAATVCVAAIIAGGLIAYPVALRHAPLHDPLELLTAAIALAGATMLVAAGIYVCLRLLLWRGAAIVIDSHGIHDRRSGTSVVPWSRIHDVRILDRHGHHIGIETLAAAPAEPASRPGWLAAVRSRSHSDRLTVIDTFFLRSITGNRVLDFVMPLTAVAPIDMSETPVSEDTLSADARISRMRGAAVALFILAAGVIPAAAASFLLFR